MSNFIRLEYELEMARKRFMEYIDSHKIGIKLPDSLEYEFPEDYDFKIFGIQVRITEYKNQKIYVLSGSAVIPKSIKFIPDDDFDKVYRDYRYAYDDLNNFIGDSIDTPVGVTLYPQYPRMTLKVYDTTYFSVGGANEVEFLADKDWESISEIKEWKSSIIKVLNNSTIMISE